MDLNSVTQFYRPASIDFLPEWREGYAWLAGGTWLFSEPQPSIRALVDLESLSWPALNLQPDGLEIAATCKIAELNAFCAPPEWKAAPLFGECCQSLQASFKIWNAATVGGNICMSLPAGAMIALASALEGVGTIWSGNGASREVPIVDFVTGNHTNVLAPGELLRQVRLPASALRKRFAFRRFSLSSLGRSSVLLIGTLCPIQYALRLTVTAATVRPIQLPSEAFPSAASLRAALDELVRWDLYFDDPHGTAEHRQHLTYHYAEQIRVELESY